MKLTQAARTNDVVQVRRYTGRENINQHDEYGNTPLLLAVNYNNNEAVLALLSAGADTEWKDNRGYTALMVACFKGYTKVAKLLIEHGAVVHSVNNNNETALTFATLLGQQELVRLLLIYGADPLKKDHTGKNALDHARTQQNVHNYELMVAAANNYLL
ncbi:hypothetical protein Q765_01715 [Flavobacterium rivuli WB 3.3-2 = DSM 21788]|uniref:Uncharacterized protein n=1 Tax=Flavobacterium rivuli WB 3.3-2 = DSM 21788 TaxID=1121895 RepID=A0A0A2M8R4_9FLAO|nr:ankyrin repeat domain-containing protein [Flavobacterium rivuli]KGO88644.1 hypothetical protein Q765_01715 [Flavobacterium rivuli WB 3.3-2 = DSM 21788]